MDEKPTKPGGRATAPIVAVALVLLPTLYVLSVGPAFALWQAGWIGWERKATLEAVYYPIIVVAANNQGARALFVDYVNLWLAREYETY